MTTTVLYNILQYTATRLKRAVLKSATGYAIYASLRDHPIKILSSTPKILSSSRREFIEKLRFWGTDPLPPLLLHPGSTHRRLGINPLKQILIRTLKTMKGARA